jgi:serine/threonine-protein kinase HipA
MRSLAVYIDARRIGTLSEDNNLWQFEYEHQWVDAADAYSLSPALPLEAGLTRDGGTLRPVQWYFDNLLPEEGLRETQRIAAGIRGDDAFALLEYLGQESAGSITLVAADAAPPAQAGLQPLPDEALAARIVALPRAALSNEAPKRMSLAGAQHKLLVVYRDGELFEPVGATASTHILKPNHPSNDYRSTVINEFFVMNLADELGLEVPKAYRKYTPEPVYIVERFDRATDHDGNTRRLHIIDGCQLLNKARTFKYTGMTYESLQQIIELCRNKLATRQRLFQWVLFNTLVGNNDNHLKNLSFMVSHDGVELAPHYDLLSTATYQTKTFAGDRASWPDVELALALPPVATKFGEVTSDALRIMGDRLGLASRTVDRLITKMVDAFPAAVERVKQGIDQANERLHAQHAAGAESRLIHAVEHVTVKDMLDRMRDTLEPERPANTWQGLLKMAPKKANQ